MPFDGNGNWTSNFNAEADRDAGYKILASRFDNILLADLAQSFENCLTKDTQIKPQTNFNANNYRVINVADPVDNKDAVNLQTFNSSADSKLDTLLATLYPVGSIYIGTQETCPLETLISDSTWVKIEGRYLLASGTLTGTSEEYSATDTVASGVPNITGSIGPVDRVYGEPSGAFYANGSVASSGWTSSNGSAEVFFDASRSSSVYGSSSAVRSPAYVVNVWRRTA